MPLVVNTAGLLAEDLCLAFTKPDGRVVTALTQPPGLRCQGPGLGLGLAFGSGLGHGDGFGFGHCVTGHNALDRMLSG